MDLYKVRKELMMGIPLTDMKLRVTDYARVSTIRKEQQTSLKNQVEHFEEMIKNNSNWEYIDGYVDDGISGVSDYKRDSFMNMIEDAKKGKFDLIITKEISRFSRNTLDSIKYTRELLNYGVAVLFLNDNINTALPDSELRLTIMASMAQDEIRRLSERVKFGMNRAIKNGVILGNNMLYGYKKDKLTGNLIIIKEEAIIVKKIFQLYVHELYSLSKICKLLNQDSNKKWSTVTISRMISNPKYKGYYCGKKKEVISYMTKKVKELDEKEWIMYKDYKKIPPIIDEKTWDIANKRLKSRKLKFGKDYKDDKTIYKNRYPLSAKIFCSNDNCVFHRRKNLKSKDVSWICSNHLVNGKNKCNLLSIREKELYNIFKSIITSLNINMLNVSKLLISFYKNKQLENDINKIINDNFFLDIIIENILKKVVVKRLNDDTLKLNIYLNIDKRIRIKDKYFVFFRGHNKSLKKHKINYLVEIM